MVQIDMGFMEQLLMNKIDTELKKAVAIPIDGGGGGERSISTYNEMPTTYNYI